ncbi:hypothetical protein [Streptomyces sp. NBC_01264]|uniref:hypothetical protein n=1 Tax=Streptomyces sp. NBC_01264 TaxID=2903804 RepID=UPI0022568D9F|nr:hypothetical protein [Streptomyces sp. NBC_01264]MCX4779198.1 hypothetical protein [Streptomyces sp. NBC_01264]
MTPPSKPAPVHRPRVFVFDSEVLSKAVRGDRAIVGLVNKAWDRKVPVVTSGLTTLEAWDPRPGKEPRLWDWSLSRIEVVHADDPLVGLARALLTEAGLHGHTYAIDAVLAAVAVAKSRRGAQVTVFTSDVDDLGRLLSGHPVVVESV